jgi:hypothetical protein
MLQIEQAYRHDKTAYFEVVTDRALSGQLVSKDEIEFKLML